MGATANIRQSRSLRALLLAAMITILLVTLVSGGAIIYLHAVDKVRTEMEAAIAVGTRIARNAVDDFDEQTNPRRRLQLLVADFDGDRHLVAFLINPDQSVGRASELALSESPAPEWFIGLLPYEPLATTVELPEAFSGQGSIVLRTDPRNEIGEVWDEAVNTVLILGLFCVLVLTLLAAAMRWILHPLGVLSDAIQAVGGSQRTATPLAERGPVEIVALVRGFNDMIDRLGASEARSRQLNEQLTRVQDEERAEIARDLHDEVGPLLFSIDIDTAAVARACESGDTEKALQRLGLVRLSVEQTQRSVRNLLGMLRPAALLDMGLGHAVANLVSFWTSRNPGLRIDVDLPPEPLGESLDAVLYRLIQESVANSLKHGAPSHIDIQVVEEAGRIVLRVSDDGGGLAGTTLRNGYGIKGMGERVRAHGGTMTVRNRDGGGGVIVEAVLDCGRISFSTIDGDAADEGTAALSSTEIGTSRLQ